MKYRHPDLYQPLAGIFYAFLKYRHPACRGVSSDSWRRLDESLTLFSIGRISFKKTITQFSLTLRQEYQPAPWNPVKQMCKAQFHKGKKTYTSAHKPQIYQPLAERRGKIIQFKYLKIIIKRKLCKIL